MVKNGVFESASPSALACYSNTYMIEHCPEDGARRNLAQLTFIPRSVVKSRC